MKKILWNTVEAAGWAAPASVCSQDHLLSRAVVFLGKDGGEDGDAFAVTDAAGVAMVWLRALGASDPPGRFQ